MKNRIRVLFILSRLLGGKTFSNQLVSAVSELEEIDPIFLFLDPEDYRLYKSPSFMKFFSNYEAPYIVSKKVQGIGKAFDCLFIQSFELILGLKKYIKQYPSILAHDSTNVLSYELIYRQSPNLRSFGKYQLKRMLTIPLYRSIINNIDFFMPRTHWCAESLKKIYDVGDERILITPAGIDTDFWKPLSWRETNEKPVLLFVGNDLVRKGAYFLLDIYSKYLSSKCNLKIISNDKSLDNAHLPSGVNIYKGFNHTNIKELLCQYQTADIFVFPSFKDHMGIVLTEAAAVGLPIIARDVGGASEIVKDGINGYLLDYRSQTDEWADKIGLMINNPNNLLSFGENSRRLALENFSKLSLKIKLLHCTSQLINKQ
jgi:glycosyltransferase involved in cell wall biosynthesis